MYKLIQSLKLQYGMHQTDCQRSRVQPNNKEHQLLGVDHQSIGQLLSKLPDRSRSRSSVDPASTPAETIDPTSKSTSDQTQPTQTTQTTSAIWGFKTSIVDKTENDLNPRVEKWDQEQILVYPQP